MMRQQQVANNNSTTTNHLTARAIFNETWHWRLMTTSNKRLERHHNFNSKKRGGEGGMKYFTQIQKDWLVLNTWNTEFIAQN